MLPSKVSRGQPIRANDMNEILSRLRAVDSTPTGAGALKGFKESAFLVTAVEAAGGDYPAFSALAFESLPGDDPINQSGRRAVKVRKAQAGDEGRLCILGSAMTKGVAPIAYIGGLCPVLITRTADDAGKAVAARFSYAELKAGATALEAAGGGSARIVWEEEAESLTAAHLAFVQFPLGSSAGTFASPRDATYAGEHEEEARDDLAYTGADDDEVLWDRRALSIPSEEEGGEATTFDGFKSTMSLGAAYYEAGDQILYQYVADFTWDSRGCLVKVSKERRVVIESPLECECPES
jgi:hypothetical protein